MDYFKKYSDKIQLTEIFDYLIDVFRNSKENDYSYKKDSLSINFKVERTLSLVLKSNKTEIRINCNNISYIPKEVTSNFYSFTFYKPNDSAPIKLTFNSDVILKNIEELLLKENFIEKIYFAELFKTAINTILDKNNILELP